MSREVEEEFGDQIINKKILPIVLDMNTGKQQMMDNSAFNRKGYGVDQLIKRVQISDPNKFPVFSLRRKDTKNKTRFIEVKLDDGEREFQVPISFQKLTDNHKRFIKKNREDVKRGEQFSVGIPEVSKIESTQNVGYNIRDNTTNNIWDLLFKTPS